MIIRLSIENFRSFKESAVLDFVSNSHIRFDNQHRHKFGRMSVVKNVGVFGANASGKTATIDAVRTLMRFVVSGYLPENLAFKGQEKKPTVFDIVFEKGNRFFEYRFSVKIDEFIHQAVVLEETLHELTLSGKSDLLYDSKSGLANPDNPDFATFEKGYKNTSGTLFLSYIVAPERQIKSSKTSGLLQFVHSFFADNLVVILKESEMLFSICEESVGLIRDRLHDYDTGIEKVDFIELMRSEEIKLFSEPAVKMIVADVLSKGLPENQNLYYCDGEDVFMFRKASKGIKAKKLLFKHMGIKEPLPFKDESEGTKVIFLLILTLLCQDNSDRAVFVDEIERSSHPMVVKRIIEDYQLANAGNKAQLVFSSHLGSLMDSTLKRDEIYFVEKDDFGSSTLFSLQEFATANRRESVEQKYYEGRYGALPKIGVRVSSDGAN